MGIIPKQGEAKEPIGIIGVLVVHYLAGLGITVIGQRTKNITEFWGGVVFFILMVSFLIMEVSGFESTDAFLDSDIGTLYLLSSLISWIYVIARLIYIYVKKTTRFNIL